MKSIAIMQPYFFPYLGYWQLIHAVDRFVIYDDVNFIKGGWINRNRILINGEPTYMSVPLHESSQNKRICDIKLQATPIWRDKLIKMVEITYKKSSNFVEVFPIVEKIIRYETDSLPDYLANQLQALASFIGINTEFVVSSRCYENNVLSGQERILDICRLEGVTTYINPQGGKNLYDTEVFYNAGVDLKFISMRALPYQQRTESFVPFLSIVDVLMELGPNEIMHHLDAFDLLSNTNSAIDAIL